MIHSVEGLKSIITKLINNNYDVGDDNYFNIWKDLKTNVYALIHTCMVCVSMRAHARTHTHRHTDTDRQTDTHTLTLIHTKTSAYTLFKCI